MKLPVFVFFFVKNDLVMVLIRVSSHLPTHTSTSPGGREIVIKVDSVSSDFQNFSFSSVPSVPLLVVCLAQCTFSSFSTVSTTRSYSLILSTSFFSSIYIHYTYMLCPLWVQKNTKNKKGIVIDLQMFYIYIYLLVGVR